MRTYFQAKAAAWYDLGTPYVYFFLKERQFDTNLKCINGSKT